MKFFVTYRRNDLFDKYVPQIFNGLPVAGTFTIPAGTELDDHSEEYVRAMSGLSEQGVTHLLTDVTCIPWKYQEITGSPVPGLSVGPGLGSRIISLDWLFAEQITNWIGEQTKVQNIQWFAKAVAKDRPVSRVLVVRTHIHDHTLVGSGEIVHDIPDHASWIAQQLETCFSAQSSVVETLHEALEEANGDPFTMIVVDRHAGLKHIMTRKGNWYNSFTNWPYNAILFTLPLETCAAQLIDAGTLPYSFDIKNMKNEILKAARPDQPA